MLRQGDDSLGRVENTQAPRRESGCAQVSGLQTYRTDTQTVRF